MTTIIRTIVLALVFTVTGLHAQDFQGGATYKTQRQIDINLDRTQVKNEMQNRMMEMMKKQFQKTFHRCCLTEVCFACIDGRSHVPVSGCKHQNFQIRWCF